MSKGLEALEMMGMTVDVMCSTEYVEAKKVVERELKALEIIKKKQVNVWAFNMCNSVGAYNASRPNDMAKPLTQEEFDFLKEALK